MTDNINNIISVLQLISIKMEEPIISIVRTAEPELLIDKDHHISVWKYFEL
jgi:hypothetical protein